MKTLTVKQPFAAWIADGHKKIEYRSWATGYRGPLLITASSAPARHKAGLSDGTTRILPAGCLVCIVDLINITGESGRYEWHLENPRAVVPRAVKGKLNIWEYDGEIKQLPAGMDWLDYKKGG